MLRTVAMTTNTTAEERPRQRQQQLPFHPRTTEIMFHKFDPSLEGTTPTQVKASVQRAVKPQILDTSLLLTIDIMDELLPPKPFSPWSGTRLVRT